MKVKSESEVAQLCPTLSDPMDCSLPGSSVHSVLDDIPGVGPTRRKALMKHFVNIDEIKNATLDELKELPSMNEKSAIEVYKYFH